jgi:hypothetical protein
MISNGKTPVSDADHVQLALMLPNSVKSACTISGIFGWLTSVG